MTEQTSIDGRYIHSFHDSKNQRLRIVDSSPIRPMDGRRNNQCLVIARGVKRNSLD
jgi:hypothetical protein